MYILINFSLPRMIQIILKKPYRFIYFSLERYVTFSCYVVLFFWIWKVQPVRNVKSQFSLEFFINLIVIGYFNFKHGKWNFYKHEGTIASRINNYINQRLVTEKVDFFTQDWSFYFDLSIILSQNIWNIFDYSEYFISYLFHMFQCFNKNVIIFVKWQNTNIELHLFYIRYLYLSYNLQFETT